MIRQFQSLIYQQGALASHVVHGGCAWIVTLFREVSMPRVRDPESEGGIGSPNLDDADFSAARRLSKLEQADDTANLFAFT